MMKDNRQTYLDPQPTIVAVGGGKGGVGKSFVASNLGIFLAGLGHQILLVDLDLGAANLHTCLGFSKTSPGPGLADFFQDSNMPFKDIMNSTNITNLSLVHDCQNFLSLANLEDSHRNRLTSSIGEVPADYIIFDLSSGTHQATLDFFLMAQHHVVIMTPDPSSIENAYHFIRSVCLQKIRNFAQRLPLNHPIGSMMEQHQLTKFPVDLIKKLVAQDSLKGPMLANVMNTLQFNIIVNQTRSYKEAQLGDSIRSVITQCFGLESNLLGHLEYDNAVWQSLRRKKPFLFDNPQSPLYVQFMRISRNLLNTQPFRAVV